jgi:DNA-binding NtrC family response regulator
MMEKVLIVDDDETTRKRLQRIIAKEGLEALVAEDGAQAMEVFERTKPDIVMTDLRMPKIDGMELLHHVKRMEPLTQVILITAFGDYDLAIHALRGGALDYLRKPIDLDRLFVALGRARENIAKYRDQVPPPTILVIEDDEVARDRMARVLRKEGYRVVTAHDGEDGMRRFEESKVDVILADLRMPKKDGLNVLREVRQITEDVETIVVTGYGDEESAIQAMREGAVNYLKKPIDLDQLLLAITKALERLNLKRSVLFRKRDLELAREIVAKVTSKKELLVDVRNGARKSAVDFAESLVDSLPLNLMVLDEEMNVLFVNRGVKARVGESSITVGTELFEDMGLGEISIDEFTEAVRRVYRSAAPSVECMDVSQYAFVLLSKLFVLTDEGIRKVVLVVLRGERGLTSAPAGAG